MRAGSRQIEQEEAHRVGRLQLSLPGLVVGIITGVGALIYLRYRNFGQYFVDGVGYATIQSILQDQSELTGLIALLFVCKLAATFVSLGSGSSGGIFSPSLFVGATLGGGFAAAILAIAPGRR
jgi:CIC family chloride channel protein